MDELVARFVSITSASVEDATRFLLTTNSDLEQAVELYLAGSDMPTSRSETSSRPDIEDGYVRTPDKTTRLTLLAPMGRSIVPPASSLFSSSNRAVNAPFTGLSSATADSHDRKLARIFKPPHRLLFKGTLDAAKKCCAIDKKWLLVNIQDETDFSCLVLNRCVSHPPLHNNT